MPLTPLFLPPALPSELLTFIIEQCTYPTTLIVCSTRADFVSALADDIRHQTRGPDDVPAGTYGAVRHADEEGEPGYRNRALGNLLSKTVGGRLLAAPLFQLAVAKHIRVVFVSTVVHLRVFLSLFSVADSGVPPPPALPGPAATAALPQAATPPLLVFGFVDLHRDTSEWSAQGLSNTAATLVDAARDAKFRPVVVEPERHGDDAVGLDRILQDAVPVLSSNVRRSVPGLEEAGWTGRTVPMQRVLGRWFTFRKGRWKRPYMGGTGQRHDQTADK